MTRGAAAVAAGVVDIVFLTTVLAWPQLPAQDLGPARAEIREGPAMAGRQILLKPVQVLAALPPQDLRHRQHARAPERLESGHEGGAGGVPHVQGRGRQMGVARGGPWALVAEQFLDDSPRHAPFQQMGRIGVPQRRDGGILGHATLAYHELEGLLKGGRRERRLLVPGGEQPGAGPLALPVGPQQLQHRRGQGDEAVFASFALAHAHQHAWRVDVRDLPLGPFPQAQPTGIDQLQTHPGCWVRDPGQQGPDLPPTQHDRQCLGVPGAHEVEDGPRAVQCALVEESNPVEVNAEGALGDPLLMDQEEEVLAEFVFTALARSAPVVWRQMLDGFDVTVLGPGSQAPQRQLFEHTASEWGHGHPPVRVGYDPSQRVDTNGKIKGGSR
jgi:hypothetical protein